jgi:hypothetical protein
MAMMPRTIAADGGVPGAGGVIMEPALKPITAAISIATKGDR